MFSLHTGRNGCWQVVQEAGSVRSSRLSIKCIRYEHLLCNVDVEKLCALVRVCTSAWRIKKIRCHLLLGVLYIEFHVTLVHVEVTLQMSTYQI